jgi:hypothetical protein
MPAHDPEKSPLYLFPDTVIEPFIRVGGQASQGVSALFSTCPKQLLVYNRGSMETNSTDRGSVLTALAFYYALKFAQVTCCGISIYLGYKLFRAGVTGHASLSVESHKVSGQLLNAAPGLFFGVGESQHRGCGAKPEDDSRDNVI